MSYQAYKNHLKQLADVNYASALLQWDQEVYMPEKGGSYRASQLSTLSGIAHQLATDPAFEKIVADLANDSSLTDKEKSNVLRTRRDIEKRKKFTREFVEEMSI